MENNSSASITRKAPVHITPTALQQLNRIMQEQNIPADHGLRVGVKGGGCSGFSYILGFDSRKDKDDVFETAEFRIFMEKAHAIYLVGMEIDWHDGLDNRGFVFNNPNATDTCGCGSSFSA